MNANNAAVASQKSPFTNGPILSAAIYQSPRAELPGLGSFLSQGAAFGPLLAFLWPLFSMLLNPENGYNFLLISFLPVILAAGVLYGLCEATFIWALTFLVGHRINLILRALFGVAILYLLFFAFDFLFRPRHDPDEIRVAMYWINIGVRVGCGVIFGLAIGSGIRPLYELLRGSAAWPVSSGITGLLLRPLVIFSLMVSILSLILSLQGDFKRPEFVFSAVAVFHFIGAVVIVFTRMPFWLLLPLALLVNFPIVAIVTDVLKPEDVFIRTLTINYLVLWAAFLSCRVSLPRRPLAFIKQELRYYLID